MSKCAGEKEREKSYSYTIVEGESTMAVLRSTSESGLVCLYGGTWSLPEQADQIVWGALSYEARMNGLSCWVTWWKGRG